jgi:single-stranded-DNA-specific exonuclease
MRWIESHIPPSSSPLPDLHPLVGQTLIRRGILTPDAARAFLKPEFYSPASAFQLPGMNAAAERVARAITSREPICIWGDFDVDGQTATSLLVQTLQAFNANVTYYIPVRARESHGVHIPSLEKLIDNGAKLVITCDTGITAHEAVTYARSRGVDMVITDHHDPEETLPDAIAATNPKLLNTTHPLANLPGVGVAFKLAEALFATLPPADLQLSSLLDLVALGTVADLALLRGDTRYLVQKGLAALRKTERLGLKTIMEMADIKPENITENHIGFAFGPRLNALGRLDDANPAVELLTTQDPSRARVLVTQIEGLNAQRKLLCDQVTQAAEAQLKADPSLLSQPIIILGHETWPGGVVGIVASRIVERYGKPAILLSLGADGIARGSARSIDGLHITEAISAQKDLLRNFGGHPMAAGLGLELDKLPEFRKRIGKTVESMLAKAHVEEAVLTLDGWINLPEISLDLAGQIEQLAPFGPGNERLTLATRNLTLKNASPVGRGAEHVRLTLEDSAGNTQTVLWWGGGSEELPSETFDLAYTIRSNDYKGQKQVTVEFVDFRAAEAEKITVKRKKLEVEDWRGQPVESEKWKVESSQGSVMVWAEGEHKKLVNGKGRHELSAADMLVVWTAPASPEVFRAAMERVKPKKVILVGENPGLDEPKAFLERLAGLVKFILNKKNGQTSLLELAAATAGREAAVRCGVDWLVKRGQVSARFEAGGEIALGVANARGDESAASQLESQLRNILNESAAYREHFSKAEKDALL